jgi:tetratricopeptide (TPR) repeat protein
MRHGRVLVWGLIGWVQVSAAIAAVDAGGFDAANKLYEQGKFAESAAAYRSLIQSGTVSPALYFNLGNACFKAGELGRALAAYCQARELAPRDPDVRANLRFVRDQVQGPTRPPGRWERALARLTLDEWTLLASIALWIWLLSLAGVQLRPAWKSSLRFLVWSSSVATIILASVVGARLSLDASPTAIVTVHQASIRNGPLDESPATLTVHDGAELKVTDRKDDWLQVVIANRTGWLRRDQVALLPGG